MPIDPKGGIWFSHSRPEYTDWYGEDNYFNNAQWARHLLERLPAQLGDYPEKPYIIGESILFNTWPDIDALDAVYWSSADSPWRKLNRRPMVSVRSAVLSSSVTVTSQPVTAAVSAAICS